MRTYRSCERIRKMYNFFRGSTAERAPYHTEFTVGLGQNVFVMISPVIRDNDSQVSMVGMAYMSTRGAGEKGTINFQSGRPLTRQRWVHEEGSIEGLRCGRRAIAVTVSELGR